MRQLTQNWAPKKCVIYIDPTNPFTISIQGRELWALTKLLESGATGCTAQQVGAARLAAYVHKLRNRGIRIETNSEPNRGDFPGSHARYVLVTEVQICGKQGSSDE